jgi:rare lipoprotein A
MSHSCFISRLPLVMLVFLLSLPAWANTPSGIEGYREEGIASWYGGKFQGRKTANGEIFDTNELTAAHKTLPFGTIVKVTSKDSGESVEVRINDRGPFVEGRVIDLSRAAADKISMVGSGVANVRLEVISGPPGGVPQDLYRRHEKGSTSTIQVASFTLKENADRSRNLLTGSGIPAVIEETPSGHFRVVVPDVARGAVPGMKNQLASLGYPSVLVRNSR